MDVLVIGKPNRPPYVSYRLEISLDVLTVRDELKALAAHAKVYILLIAVGAESELLLLYMWIGSDAQFTCL